MSSEPQALTVSFLHPSTEFPSSGQYCRMAAGALTVYLHCILEEGKGKMTEKIPCQLRSALFKQPPGSPRIATLLMAQPE